MEFLVYVKSNFVEISAVLIIVRVVVLETSPYRLEAAKSSSKVKGLTPLKTPNTTFQKVDYQLSYQYSPQKVNIKNNCHKIHFEY